MSSIQRVPLAIQGIRSFDSSKRETIYFETPLTLIVGHNGSGKTTIIECLRYVTTGDLPPNSKGGAFIHDPKIANETEVLAQVKLGFTSTNGAAMICSRSMSVTLKKNASRTFKTLEGQLIVNGDKRSNISTRCAELDTLMPQLLGVSKSILDYVVFCHQDESLWPLSEPAALKKRFDEIFEALKYTKALDACKAIRKERADHLKLLERDVQHLSSDKSKADRLRTSTDQLISNIAKYEEDAEIIDANMKRVEDELNALFKSTQEFQAVLSKLDQQRSTLHSLQEQCAGLESSLVQESTDSDQALQDKLDSFGQYIAKQREDLDVMRAKIGISRVSLEQRRSKHGRALVEEGKLNADAEAQALRIARRETMAKEISSRHNIPGYRMSLDDTQVEEFLTKLKDAVRSRMNKVTEVKSEAEAQLTKVRQKIQQFRDEKSNHEVKLSLYKNTNAKRREDIRNVQNDIEAISIDEAQVSYEEEKCEELEKKAREATNLFENRNFSQLQNEKSRVLQAEEQKLEEINAELTLSNSRADMRAKLGLLKEDISKHEKALNILITVNQANFQKLTGATLGAEGSESKLQEAQNELQRKLDAAVRSQETVARELSKIETRFVLASEDLQKQKDEMTRVKRLYDEKVEIDADIGEYEQVLQSCDDQPSAFEHSKFIEKYYSRALTEARTSHRCSLCKQSIRDDSDDYGNDDEHGAVLSKFEEDINRLLKEMKELAPTARDIEEAKYDYQELNAMGKDVAKYRELLTTVPETEKTLASMSAELNDTRKSMEAHTEEVDDLKRQAGQLDALRRPVSEINRITRELSEIEAEIMDQRSQLDDSGSGRSMEEIETDRQNQTEVISKIRKELARLGDEKERHRNQISAMENQVRDRKLKLAKVLGEFQTKKDLINRVEILEHEYEETKKQIEILNQRLQSTIPALEAEMEILKNTREHFAAAEAEAASSATILSNSLTEFESIHSEIQQYIQKGFAERLAKVSAATVRYESEVAQLSDALERDAEEASRLERELANIGTQQREIEDNLQLRKVRAKIDATARAIAELERKNADQDKRKYEEATEKLRDRFNSLNADYGGKIGGIKQMKDQVERAEMELRTEFHDVHKKYREMRLEQKLVQAGVADLGIFMKALDSAIMQYHSLKMEEINRIIDELWKKTYSGTDVDTILIRSDDESERANRSYNYRVCMVKQDVELDMRGRCSAGQKVLASIIIRLALAECFGVNCGIIALDEPTTNLDEENIQSLARSLGSIIEARSSQKNFQLIVITHDENFLRYMNGSKYCEHYYRVSRDERQKSQIERQKLSEVF